MGFLRNVVFIATGVKHFGKAGYQNASKNFDAKVMDRDLKGKHCMVTGCNQGIGYQAALDLAQRGCSLIMVCRNEQRGKDALQKIVDSTGNSNVQLKVCDVSSLAQVQKLAEDYNNSGDSLHVLVLNAGTPVLPQGRKGGFLAQERQTSADGYELSFATQTLVGTFALARLLLPSLKRSAPSKIIIVSSGGQYTEPLVIDDMECKKMRKYDGSIQYARDKRRQVALAERFDKLWSPAGVHCYSMHPGWTETQGVKDQIPGFWKTFGSYFRPLSEGADTITYLALQDVTKLEGGGFYLDRAAQDKHLPLSGTQYTAQQVDTLWTKLSQMAKLPEAQE